MNLQRQGLSLTHAVRFLRPAAALTRQSGRLIEALFENLVEYTIASKDVQRRRGASLDLWGVQITMFNGLGNIEISADGLEATFNKLQGGPDVAVVTQVQEQVLLALSETLPTIKYVSEIISGTVTYKAQDGVAGRDDFFSKVVFPQRSASHQDVTLKFRMAHQKYPNVLGSIELAPLWTVPDGVAVFFSIDTTEVASEKFASRAQIASELITAAIESVGVNVIEL